MDIRKSTVILDPSEIPFDITFLIEDCGSKVRAHKWIMAMGSPVCMKQFYGELKETSEEILIKNTTKDAFVAMVDAFYGRDIIWVRDGFKKKKEKKLLEFSIKGPDPASQHLNEKKTKKTWSKNALNHLK